ncbi:MAG: ZIP family metal transporter [Nanoarchaeota archaeon]
MKEVWFYSLASVFVVSLISLIGVLSVSIKPKHLNKFLIYLIAFAAGGLFGGAFLHLMPELVDKFGFGLMTSGLLLGGIVLFFSMEKLIQWQHCHMPFSKGHVHSFAIMNLIGDGFHNFLDGLIIGASYLINIPTGIATTIAVGLHEIPQEIGDFGILLRGGFSKIKAMILNFMSALLAVAGAVTSLILGGYIGNVQFIIIPIAIGGFIYIAGSDLIPELHKEFSVGKAFLQLISFVAGILVMVGLLWLG